MKQALLIKTIARKDTSHLIFCVVYIPKLELLEYKHSYQRIFGFVKFIQVC